MKQNSPKWIAAIVDRGKGQKAASIFHQYNNEILLAVRGHGTASSAIIDCLGFDEPEKDLVLGIATGPDSRHVMDSLRNEMEFQKPGHGIAFSVPLSGISIAISSRLKLWGADAGTLPRQQTNTTTFSKEEHPMSDSNTYELIAAVINTDLSTPVMDAARKAGCHGGTLVKAREIGTDQEKKLFGLTLSQEKAILLILTPVLQKHSILRAICETVLRETGEHAVAFSLPVDEVEGISM